MFLANSKFKAGSRSGYNLFDRKSVGLQFAELKTIFIDLFRLNFIYNYDKS